MDIGKHLILSILVLVFLIISDYFNNAFMRLFNPIGGENMPVLQTKKSTFEMEFPTNDTKFLNSFEGIFLKFVSILLDWLLDMNEKLVISRRLNLPKLKSVVKDKHVSIFETKNCQCLDYLFNSFSSFGIFIPFMLTAFSIIMHPIH